MEETKKEASFHEFFHTYRKDLVRYAFSLLPVIGLPPDMDYAEDAVQDVFLLAWKKYDEIITHKNPKGWLIEATKNVLRNMARSELRNANRIARLCTLGDFTNFQPPPGAELELEGLTSDENLQLLKRVYVNGESYETICQELNIKKSSLAMRLKRAKEEIRKKYMEI